MMKDESKDKHVQLIGFIGLRPKVSATKIQDPTPEDKKKERKCKGVKKSVVENNMTFENYKECLFGGKTLHAKFNTLKPRKHNVTTECITKVALTPKDDKRYIIPNDPEHKAITFLFTLSNPAG